MIRTDALQRACRHGAILAACCGALARPALAHEGHDHAPPPAAATQPLAPRIEAKSPDFELLGMLRGGELVVYLDRYASNDPVAGATLELESGDHKAQGQEQADGSYRFPAGPLQQPGRHALVFAVEAGEHADLLNGTLEVAAAAASSAPATGRSWRLPTLSAGLAGLALLIGGWIIRRRKGVER